MNLLIFTIYVTAHTCVALTDECGPQTKCRCFTTAKSIKEIDCTNSNLTLPEVCEYVRKENISRVTIMRYKFELLVPEDFDGCENVISLNLRRGSLSIIQRDAFKSMQKLQEMDLSWNSLSCLYTRNVLCRLDHLESIKLLYINGNVKNLSGI